MTAPNPTPCSVDGCGHSALVGATIGYWGMEAWVYLCGTHMIEKRKWGEEYDPCSAVSKTQTG
jgi:hypothetical protein